MEPASTVIGKLGGPTKVAQVVGVHRTRVSNWARPKESGGTGGVIPMRHVPKLLALAQEKGIKLSADDFIPAQERAE